MPKPDLCPACGARNDCSLADPQTADRACWCFAVTIDPAVLAALPDDLRDMLADLADYVVARIN